MNKRVALTLTAVLVGACVLSAAPSPGPAPADDIAAIKANTKEFQAAWNRHDAKAIASFWSKDGDLIDPWGVASVGHDAVEKFFTEQHNGTGKLAHVSYDNKDDSVRLVSPDVAVEDWQVVLSGLTGEDGKPMGPQFHRVVVVSVREGGKWKIAAARPGLPTPAKDGATTPPAKPGK